MTSHTDLEFCQSLMYLGWESICEVSIFCDLAELASLLWHPRAYEPIQLWLVPLLRCSVLSRLEPWYLPAYRHDSLCRLCVLIQCVCLSLPLRLLWSKLVSLENLLELTP